MGDGSTYIGTLTRSTSGVFSGSITEPADGTEIYFYFVGGLTPSATLEAGTTSSFTVDISDQSAKMPVLSCNHVTYTTGTTSYSCVLQNQCALVQFTTASGTDDPVHVGGLYTEAQIDFASKTIAHTDYTATDGKILTGTLNGEPQPYKINVNTDGATVTLRNSTINGKNDEDNCSWAGITCENNTTLVIEGTNNVTGFYEDYPGIHIASGKTLTIQGSGTLNASSNGGADGWGAGIGGSDLVDCGNIVINSGTINATGGFWMAGIGGGFGKNCGSITINGGNVTATGGRGAAGIGTGVSQVDVTCGDISITGGIVNATGGRGAAGIGSGFVTYDGIHNTCGNISITGGQVTATGGDGGDHVCPDILTHNSWANQSYYGGAGIGTGSTTNKQTDAGSSSCGSISITGGQVTATKGGGTRPATNSIGKNESTMNQGTCGTVEIGGTEYPSGATPNQSDGLTFIYPMVTTITWDQTTVGSICINVNENYKYTDGIITIEPSTNNAIWSGNSIQLYDTEDKLTFSTSTGNITKIEITFDEMVGIPSSNWTCTDHKLIWNGFSSFVELGCMASAKSGPDPGDEPGVGPGVGSVIIEPIFQLTFVTKVEFTVRQ